MKVQFTPSARAQFLSALLYIQKDKLSEAVNFRNRTEELLRRLEDFPESGRIIPEFPELPFREVIISPYRFFCKIKGDIVWIVAVGHKKKMTTGRNFMNQEGKMNPGKIVALAGGTWPTFTLQAGVKLDIFTIIGQQQLTGREVAERLGGDVRGVTTLLNALTAMELLKKSEEKFANTPLSANYLSKESPNYMGYIVMHQAHLVDSWQQLDVAAVSGRPTRPRVTSKGEEEREAFLMGMFNMAMMSAPGLVKNIDLTGRRHLLDLGGGPGTWAIHFCLANPELKATVFDLHTTRPFAEKTIRRFNLSDRVDFREGDYLKDEITGQYDTVWMSQILHGEGPESCRVMMRKAMSVLGPDGLIFVHDFILNNDLVGPLRPALFSLNMLTGTESGRAYSEEQIMDMLRDAGAKDLRRLPIQIPNESGVIAGRAS